MATKRSTTEEAQAAIKAAQETAAEWVEIDRLHGWEKNPKRHPDAQVADLMKSIKRFGWGAVILARPNGEIIAGHGRMEAAKRLGLAKVPVRWLNLDPGEAHLLSLADNKLTEIGEWDDALVRDILEGAKQEGVDLTGLGWSEDELSEVLAGGGDAGTEGLTDPDAVPEAQAVATTKAGDLWLLGKHRVLCGDSTKGEDVARLMAGEKASLVVTDPPYGVSYADKNRSLNAVGRGNHIQTPIENDHLKGGDLSAFFLQSFSAMFGVMDEGCPFYVFAPQGGEQMMMMMMMMQQSGLPVRHELIWVKNNHVLGRADYHYKHEPILYGWKDGAAHPWHGERNKFSVWEVDRPTQSKLHPTMKPVELIEIPIQNSSKTDSLILDMFSGSGSTLIAAEKLGRRCFGMEISPQYCDVIVRRWQEFTGQQASLESDGHTFTEVSAVRRGA